MAGLDPQLPCLAAAVLAVLYLSPFKAPSHALTVGGQHSKFTLLCMSYDARMGTLQRFVSHYSRCPSVSDVVIAWNKGEARGRGSPSGGWAAIIFARLKSCNQPTTPCPPTSRHAPRAGARL